VSCFVWWSLLFAIPVILWYSVKQGWLWYTVPFLAIYLPFSYFDNQERNPTHKRRWDGFIHCWLVGMLCDYFRMKLVSTAVIPPEKKYIFGVHPHAVWPFQSIGIFSNWIGFRDRFPGVKPPRSTGASSVYRLPLFREVTLWIGGIEASPNIIRGALNAGENVIIVVGGSAELLECNPGTNVIYIKERKGFCKMALQTGADLVPTFGFGVTDSYRQLKIEFLKRIQRWVIKKFRIVIPLVFGRFFMFVPLRASITLAVGQPIPVAQCAEPTQEMIDALHRDYLAALQRLFEQHKLEAGYPDAQLTII